MATYVAGDPHGCFGAFRRLLAEIGFGAGDRMVVVGDLVNRGPESAEMVRQVKEREGTAEAVLGNHDIFMLLVHEGFASLHDADTTGDLLEGRDAGELCGWLRRRPLALRIGDYLVVHAGIPPDWDVTDAEREARAVEATFRGPDYRLLFRRLLISASRRMIFPEAAHAGIPRSHKVDEASSSSSRFNCMRIERTQLGQIA